MKVSYHFTKQSFMCFISSRSSSSTSFYSASNNTKSPSSINKLMHCYKNLYPWNNFEEFSNYLISCVEYNRDGLLVLNKPFGIKIHGHDKPGARPKPELQSIKPSLPECDYTIEDSLPALQKHFNLPNLAIVKSAEKYTSGVVLLSSSDKVTTKLQKSFNIAKFQKKPYLVHWALTWGYPVVPYRKEKIGIKFVEIGDNKVKQPVIVTEMSKRDCKLKKVYPVHFECRAVTVNEELSTSLVEIASSSVKWHVVRVYASSRVAPVLGDILYGSRMKTFLGIPVKVQLQNVNETKFQEIPAKMSDILSLPKGTSGQLMIPTMLHLRSIILPNYCQKDQDLTVTVNLPPHFKWTANRLNLINDCK